MSIVLDLLFPSGGVVFFFGVVVHFWKHRQEKRFSAAVVRVEFPSEALIQAIQHRHGHVGETPRRLLSVDDAVICISGKTRRAWVERQRFPLLPLWPMLVQEQFADVTVTKTTGPKCRVILAKRNIPVRREDEFAHDLVGKILHRI